MSKYSSLSQCLVDKFTISHSDANRFVKEFYNTIKETLEVDKFVKVKGLGTFKLVETTARETIDVNTHERIVIDGKQKLTFAPEVSVRDRINSPFAQFESIELDDDTDFSDIDSKYAVEKEGVAVAQTEEIVEPEQPEAMPAQPVAEAEVAVEAPERVVAEAAEEATDIPTEGNKAPDTPDTPPDEGQASTPNKSLPYIIIIIIALILIALVGYFAYRAGVRTGFQMAAPSLVEEESIVVDDSSDTLATQEPSLLQAEEAVQDAAPVEEASPQEDYNSDPRVRLGAYDIVGLETIVTVKAGQTLSSISKAYLGDGMECYVEAYNGGIKTVNVGDEVKIPKLKYKESVKKYLHR